MQRLRFHAPQNASGVFSAEAGARDPQPCVVDELPAALARLRAHPQPHFVLFTGARMFAFVSVSASCFHVYEMLIP